MGPEIKYAKTTDGVYIAYQVVGEGPVDLVLVATGLGLGGIWTSSAPFLRRLASFSRLILFDRRGSGLSDHILDREQQLTLESKMEDVRAVIDGADAAQPVLLALEFGGFAVAAMFAATLPERTAGLVGYAAQARELWAPDYPFGGTKEGFDADIDELERTWGTEEAARASVELMDPTGRNDASRVEDFVAFMRGLGGPGDAATLLRVDRDIDLRYLLPSIRVPTLVIHRERDRVTPIEHGRYVADHIPGAEFAELPGDTHMWDVGDDLPAQVERFVATIQREEEELDRYLATVLFTDIVDSTAVAAAAGDQDWAALIERHHHIVRGYLARYRGVEMDTAGDGFFATFDGPARAVRCALAIQTAVRDLPIDVRMGVHTGEMQTIDGKAGGIAVTLGARVASAAGPGEILATSTVKDLVAGSGLVFADAGERELKGIPDRWHLHRVAGIGS
jgi:class 3 adenylate cyclase